MGGINTQKNIDKVCQRKKRLYSGDFLWTLLYSFSSFESILRVNKGTRMSLISQIITHF